MKHLKFLRSSIKRWLGGVKRLLLSPKALLSSLKKSFKRLLRTKRRKILAITLISLIILTSLRLFFLTPKEVRADSLLKFDEGYGTTINDESGNVSGTITNALWRQSELCFDGMCLYFDGSGDLINFGDDPDLDFAGSANFTLEGWFRTPDITSGQRTITAKYNGATGTDGGYKVYMDANGYLIFGIDNDQTSFPSDSASTSTTAFDDNKWHHFAAIKSAAASITIYVDAIAYQTDSSITSATLVNTDSFYIGIDGDGSSNGFSGFLDEIKIYNSARTSSEIKADFLAETPTRGTSALFGPDKSYLSDGLVGYWKMDETSWTNNCSTLSVTDSSGNGNNGTACPNTTGPTGGAVGKFGNGGSFDGTDDYVDISSISKPNNFTYTAWIKTNAAGGNIIEQRIESGDIAFYLESNQLRFGWWLAPETEIIGGTINTGAWYHVAATWDGTTRRIYVNGVPAGSDNPTAPCIGCTNNWDGIGRADDGSGWSGGLDNYFNGSIDDARIYNRALSPSEIRQLADWAPGPVGYWPMDEGSWTNDCATDSVFDHSGNGNNGDACPASTGPTGGATGKFGKGGSFDGADDNVSAGSDTSIDNTFDGGGTVSAWIYPRSDGENDAGRIVFKADDPGNFGWSFAIIGEASGKVKLFFYHYFSSSPFYGQWDTTNTEVTLNQWTYVAVVYNNDSNSNDAVIYVNGQSVAITESTTPAGTRLTDSSQTIYIGNRNDNTKTFDGLIDDVRIYKYARSPSQIIEDMNAGHPAPGSPVGSAVGQWKFDEGYGDTANDSGTGGNNGNLAAGTTCPQSGDSACPTWTNSGKFGKALDFEDSGSTDDYVEITDTADLDITGEITISSWVNAESLASTQNVGLVAKYRSQTGQTDQRAYEIFLNENTDVVGFAISSDGTFANTTAIETSSTISTGTWYHLVASYKPSTYMRIYINGVLVKEQTTSIPSAIFNSPAPLWMGLQFDSTNVDLYFDGILDEVKIYNAALTADQVKLDFNQGKSTVWGATSTDSSGNATFSSQNEYCPPGQGSTCTPPVGEWKMDEKTGTTANDTSGNGNSGSFNGSPTWKHAGECQKGACLDFDGTVDRLSVSDAASLDLTQFTLSSWVKFDTISVGYIFEKGTDSNTFANYYLFYDTGVACGTNVLCSGFRSTGGAWKDHKYTWTPTAGRWYYLSSSFNGSTFKIYIDGVEVLSEAETDTPLTGNGELKIGSDRNDSRNFNGLIDNARIYNYARTPAQIAWDYNRGGPVGWWRLDECTGTVANDASGKGNNGTITIGATGSNTSAGTCGGSSGQAWFHGATGKRNASLDFDGTDDYVDLGTTPTMASKTAVTISAWINGDSFATVDRIIYAETTSTSGCHRIGINITTAGNARLSLRDSSQDPCGTITNITGTTTLATGTWYHIAATFDSVNDIHRVYVNGVIDATSTTALSALGSSATAGVNIGILEATPLVNEFDGQIDEVKIYNYALTPLQIKEIFNSGALFFGPNTGSP